MSGPNLRDLVGDIRGAVERLPKEALVDILVYVFKEYVVEGPAPLDAGTPAAPDDLVGMSFAEVMSSLQLRLDLPELELFTVEESGRVTVRLGGRAMAVETPVTRPSPPAQGIPTVAPPTSQAAPIEPPRANPPVPHAISTAPAPSASRPSAPSPTPVAPAAIRSAEPVQPPPSPRGLLEID